MVGPAAQRLKQNGKMVGPVAQRPKQNGKMVGLAALRLKQSGKMVGRMVLAGRVSYRDLSGRNCRLVSYPAQRATTI